MTHLAIRICLIVVAASGLANAASLRLVGHSTPGKVQANLTEAADSRAQVVALRAKLQKIEAGLAATLDPKGSFAKTHVAASIQAFDDELKKTMKETESMTDSKVALTKLQNAQAGVRSLMKDMTVRQMELMKEGNEQQQSLLLGVLMSKQKEPMEKQLEVLKSPDFAKLPVVEAVLRNKDTKTPLFQQVAKYLDAHRPAGSRPALEGAIKVGKNGKPDAAPIVLALEGRIHKIEENLKHHDKSHKEEFAKLDQAEKKAAAKKDTKLVHRFERLKKREQRTYEKAIAMSKLDRQSLVDAVDAIKKGDMKKLDKAKHALEQAMKAMQAHNNGFIVFIQEAHRAEGLDCPYCVAQCIETCSSSGNSYSMCLPECADAGK